MDVGTLLPLGSARLSTEAQMSPPRRAQHAVALAVTTAILGAAPRSTQANQRFWDGGGANNSWSNGSNWSSFFGAPANDGTDDIIMQGILRPTPLVDIDFDINSLQFS